MKPRYRLSLYFVLVAVLGTAGVAEAAPKSAKPAPAAAGPAATKDAREMTAREAFAAGRYQDALDVYVKLYAEKLHPVYLRNIGRCYQNLGDEDKAISSFREYQRKQKNLSAEERAEIDGYVKEMEEEKRRKEAAARPVQPVAPTVLPAAKPEPVEPQGTPVLASPATPADEPTPVYKKAWFWGVVGAVVVGGVVAAALLSGGKSDGTCEAGRICQ